MSCLHLQCCPGFGTTRVPVIIPIKANLVVLMVNGLTTNQRKLRQSDSTRSTSDRFAQCNDLKCGGFLGYLYSKPELCNPDIVQQNKF